MNEATTRQQLIDQRLRQANWEVGNPNMVAEEWYLPPTADLETTEPTVGYNRSGFSDYALKGRKGEILAIVEAKRSSKDAKTGREQAHQYCRQVEQEQGFLPFCFYTNGHEIFFWDLDHYPPLKVHGFPTRSDLERWSNLRRSRKSLSEALINTQIAGREYQIQAIRTVMERIEKQRRQFLLVMATGTGKTRTSIALVEALMNGGWAERVLFLVDRIALKEQALAAFKDHLPNEPRWPKGNETEITTDQRIYVSTYPSMLNIVRSEENPLSPHFFDLIIVDESHRSIYNTYREILSYFHAITLGLTATPTEVIDHNTFALFDCENGLPDFAYTYEEATNHLPPYLCNFVPMRLSTNIQEAGINRNTLTLADQKRLLREGKDLGDVDYQGASLERSVMNRGTNALLVKEFMEECIKDPDGVLPGKSIIFCMSKSHAARIEELFDALYPEYHGQLARRFISDDERVYGKGGLLDQFRNQSMPRVAISVDLMDTGIDVREITNLVLAKPVFSYTKFWQMIGRGTRLLDPDLPKPWCAQKDTFLLLDCWQNLDFFKLNPSGRTRPAQIPLPVRLFALRLEKVAAALELDRPQLVASEAERLQQMMAQLPTNSVVVLEARAQLEACRLPEFWVAMSLAKVQLLKQHILPLMRTLMGVDYKAMRFERDVVEASLARLLEQKERYTALCENLKEKIARLPLSVNLVAREAPLIRAARTGDFWTKATEADDAKAIDRLAPLMRFVDELPPPGEKVFVNYRDEVAHKEVVEFGPGKASLPVLQYRERVEQRILELSTTHPLLQKVRQGQPLSPEETAQLAEELHQEQPHITEAALQQVYDNRKAKLLDFIRHILGLQRVKTFEAEVSEAFQAFISGHPYLSGRQLEFLEVLRQLMLRKKEVTRKHLIEAPFTRIHREGIRGLFSVSEIDEILKLIEIAA